VLRPIYESSQMVAQRLTIAVSIVLLIHDVGFYCKLWQTNVINIMAFVQALRYIRQVAQETSGEVVYSMGRQPAVLRTFSQRLSRYITWINLCLETYFSLLFTE